MQYLFHNLYYVLNIRKNKEKECEAAGDVLGAHLNHNRQMTKKLIINSVYGVSLTNSFPLYDPDCARAICRCARVTLRDWLSKYNNEYYVAGINTHIKQNSYGQLYQQGGIIINGNFLSGVYEHGKLISGYDIEGYDKNGYNKNKYRE